MGILFGLVAAVCFGVTDFLVTQATRRVGVLLSFLAMQVVGIVVMGGVLLLLRQAPTGSVGTWALMAGIAVINFVGTVLLFRAFAIGTLAIVSPVASGFAVVTGVLGLATGERLPALALVGVGLLIVGVIVVSRTRGVEGVPSLTGVPEAIGAMLCFGTYFWALHHVTPILGALWPVWITRVVQLLCVLIVLAVRGHFKLGVMWKAWPLLFIAATLETAALLAFNIGIGQTYTTITTALTSLYSAITVLLAWLFLRERLALWQWVGVGVILAGVLLVSV